jgi:hypothetical protein
MISVYADILLGIHITDQRLYNNFDFVIKAQFRLGQQGGERWQKLMKDILYMADALSKIKVSYKV